ncbi:hypothetical protein [Enterovirga rhinocerotis]|uniref:Uncharacterized protein n=1 Tax=Enterovirga rhinocerotis TaxID=1339210 RepID=A0A4V3DXK5_9HYPH|nr:hypothetical protein [Enterovirga rhinocerotis]TDR89099.1 hypothetical protein EV668_3584 [Enterovirga rhinocerotis]
MPDLIERDLSLRAADAAHAALMYPDDVLAAQDLTTSQKRAILASWASDDRAVIGDPTRRQLPSGAVVRLREITRALTALDRLTRPAPSEEWRAARWSSDRRRRIARWIARRAPPPGDDDEPPPAPAAALPLRLEPAG